MPKIRISAIPAWIFPQNVWLRKPLHTPILITGNGKNFWTELPLDPVTGCLLYASFCWQESSGSPTVTGANYPADLLWNGLFWLEGKLAEGLTFLLPCLPWSLMWVFTVFTGYLHGLLPLCSRLWLSFFRFLHFWKTSATSHE